jgi:hypothetical protein
MIEISSEGLKNITTSTEDLMSKQFGGTSEWAR